MKALTTSMTLLFVTAAIAGCGEPSMLTQMSDVPSDISANHNQPFDPKPFVVEDVPFGPFTAINPCTGLLHDQFGTFDVRVQAFIRNTNGDHHFNIHWRFSVETSDGYSGFVKQTFVDAGQGDPGSPDEEFSSSTIFNFKVANDEGQRIIWHSHVHTTIRNGELVSFVMKNDGARCVGAPGE